MNTTILAPIVLFVYNRPWHTKQCLEALAKNELAEQSTLFIYSDGPPDNATADQLQKIQEVRDLIREKKWCKDVVITEQPKNNGLANSVMKGVTEIVYKHGKVIVLEDDLVTSKFFLKFMNDGLEFYENVEEVISVHGYVFPVKRKLPETFFLKGADCWGWATWKRGWDLFREDAFSLLEEVKQKNIKNEFDFGGAYPFFDTLQKQADKEIDSWAIRWYASAFLKNKLTLYPAKSLIANIGQDGKGTHSGKTKIFDTPLVKKSISIKSIPIEENKKAFSIIHPYYKLVSAGYEPPEKTFKIIKNKIMNSFFIQELNKFIKS